MTTKNGDQHITHKMVKDFQKKFEANPTNRLAMNAVTRTNLQEIALNRDVLNSMNFCFSHEVETGEVTDQERSSVCWLYANLNWLRTLTTKKIKVKQFEFSENYLMFYDKLEKTNYFFENIIALRDAERDSREMEHLLSNPCPEGGEWHMTVNLIQKYGAIPKSVMPDTFNRGNSRFINSILAYKLREGAAHIFNLHQKGKNISDLRLAKNEIINEVYKILAIGYGIPPKRFSWSFRDEDKKYHQEINITPKEFYKKYVGLNLDDMYCLLSSPAHDTPFGKTLTVKYFNNIHGATDLHYLNVPISTLKQLAIKIIKKGEAVQFGCDVRHMSHSKEGILDNNLYDYELLFNTTLDLDKGQRVDMRHVRLTHAMVLTGVDLVNGKPVKWKVENSWGDKVGKKGYFIMTDQWFDEYTFDLIIHKKFLTKTLLKEFEQKPIVLPPWHPMG